MKIRRRHQRRSGSTLVFAVVMMVVMIGMIAFAVDLGYVYTIRSELQRSADAAALAAAWKLCDEYPLAGNGDPLAESELARAAAGDYAGRNIVAGAATELACQDVEIGYLQPDGEITYYPSPYIAVTARVRRTAEQNGKVPLFFGRVLGTSSCDQQAQATAVFLNNISGFQPPSSGENLGILPIAMDKETWDGLLSGTGTDNWTSTWNEESKSWEVTSGRDGVLEANLFPQGTGSPGNRGTVDIGSNNNSTADISRQILHGVNAEDLDYHEGTLQLGENGELALNGDTGISAGVKDELETIKGKPRIIPIFREVSGPGNNATYTIIQFAGVRILDVKLTGNMSSKRVTIQPAKIAIQGGIPATGPDRQSYFIYSPVWLIR